MLDCCGFWLDENQGLKSSIDVSSLANFQESMRLWDLTNFENIVQYVCDSFLNNSMMIKFTYIIFSKAIMQWNNIINK